jgi:hypothetical protein
MESLIENIKQPALSELWIISFLIVKKRNKKDTTATFLRMDLSQIQRIHGHAPPGSRSPWICSCTDNPFGYGRNIH